MATEQTLAIIKPDGVMMGMYSQIERRYLQAGLKILSMSRYKMDPEQVCNFYSEHHGQNYFAGLLLAMTSGESIFLLLEGEDAIKTVRRLNGATDPSKAEPGTIRYDFPSAGGPFNVVHGSDSSEAVAREVAIVFKDTDRNISQEDSESGNGMMGF